MVGITAYGAYIPRRRLQRSAIAAANTWFDASLAAHARGERSMCSWDEDAITMAVEAGRDLGSPAPVRAMLLASTTLPFADRQNAGIVAEALDLGEAVRTMDVTGSQRAATTALMSALDSAAAGPGEVLVAAAEHRRTRVGTAAEMLSGDGAAALRVGAGAPIARYVAGVTLSEDLVDHFRGEGEDFDYEWEERWVRDEGYLDVVPRAVGRLLEEAGLAAGDVDHLVLPCALRRVPESVARRIGVREDALVDNLSATCGHTGAAHPLLLLAAVLEGAAPGARIVVTGFGQGCDALLFEATDAVADRRPRRGVSGWLERRVPEDNYARFQTFNGLVEREFGKRAEIDRPPNLSALFRNRRMVNGYVGGRCRECGTVQFPKSTYCVNPNCGAADTQDDHRMADLPGRVRTWTADRLVFDMNPPAYFGLVEFEGGGRAMVDFTDVDAERFDVDTPVGMHFRIKHVDRRRGFRSYFWKAAPSE